METKVAIETWEWLKASGICREGELVQRVVIDLQLNDVAKVYKQVIGESTWFDVKVPFCSFEVQKNAVDE